MVKTKLFNTTMIFRKKHGNWDDIFSKPPLAEIQSPVMRKHHLQPETHLKAMPKTVSTMP